MEYKVGDPVKVYSFGHWYAGRVWSLTPKRVYVDYTTGSGKRRVKPYSKEDKRLMPAD